jgi:ubiquinone/menaquinone biosynthesis C-methylase UbiE
MPASPEAISVLDVAGGPGEPSLTMAETVGPMGSVMCTDAVAEMVEAARGETREAPPDQHSISSMRG